MICINLCEVLSSDNLKEIFNYQRNNCTFSRIYIGSYFCSQYFLSIDYCENLASICNEYNIDVTLVLPVFTQKDLMLAKNKLKYILDSINKIDEITVNDIGMLNYISEINSIKVNIGRLFLKDARDARLPDIMDQTVSSECLDYSNIFEGYNVSSIEIDPIGEYYNVNNLQNIPVAIHQPFCYQTTGHICKYASIFKSIDKKFRPNSKCSRQCLNIYEIYDDISKREDALFYRIGRTVYFRNEISKSFASNFFRIIFFPFDDIINIETK